jgi:hypothetical protein
MPEPAFDPDPSPPPLPPAVSGATGKGDAPPAKSLDDLTDTGQYDTITKADLALTKQKIGAEGGMAAIQKRQDDAYAQRQERMLAAEGSTMDDLKPWNAQQEMSKRETNLWEQFGSPGFVISMLASAFTAMPMNSALNAGAAAMNAINQGKMEDYHRAFDAWKENSNLTLKRLDIEEHEFNQIGDLRTKNMESWRSQATALAARFNDKRLQIMLENGMDAQALEAMDAKAKSKVELADATKRLEDNETRRKLTMALLGDSRDPTKMAQAAADAEQIMAGGARTPEQLAVNNVISQPGFRDLPSVEQNKQIQDAVRGVASARYGGHVSPVMGEVQRQLDASDAEHPDDTPEQRDQRHLEIIRKVSNAQAKGLPAAQRDKIQGQVDAYDNNIALIDDLKERIKKYHFSVGILSGIPLAGEKLSDVLAGSSAADRAQIKSDIEKLKLGASRLLLDVQGRPIAAAEHRVDTIIRGGSYGDTTANTLKSLESLEGDYTTMRDQHKKRLSSGGGIAAPQSTPAEPKDDKSWDAFPTVGISP